MSSTFPQPFGKYVLLSKIATGGMAEIFRAKTIGAEGFEREVVIKRILPSFSEDESFVRMFIDEARIAAKLHHANIVQIFDFDKFEDSFYIAMEYVEGKDLRKILDKGQQAGLYLTPIQTMYVIIETAKGLHYAHTRKEKNKPLNIIHRDISPHNIMISYNGEVKLTDFGIAKAAARTTKTLAGTVKGKCAYMSPEQAKGKDLDSRSDLFSLGTCMWEMLTYQRLFVGETDFEILSNVLTMETPQPSGYSKEIPAELEKIIFRALEKSRDNRYPDVGAFLKDLQNLFYKVITNIDEIALASYMQRLFADEIRIMMELSSDRTMMFKAESKDEEKIHLKHADLEKEPAVPEKKTEVDLESDEERIMPEHADAMHKDAPLPESATVMLSKEADITIPPVTKKTTVPDRSADMQAQSSELPTRLVPESEIEEMEPTPYMGIPKSEAVPESAEKKEKEFVPAKTIPLPDLKATIEKALSKKKTGTFTIPNISEDKTIPLESLKKEDLEAALKGMRKHADDQPPTIMMPSVDVSQIGTQTEGDDEATRAIQPGIQSHKQSMKKDEPEQKMATSIRTEESSRKLYIVLAAGSALLIIAAGFFIMYLTGIFETGKSIERVAVVAMDSDASVKHDRDAAETKTGEISVMRRDAQDIALTDSSRVSAVPEQKDALSGDAAVSKTCSLKIRINVKNAVVRIGDERVDQGKDEIILSKYRIGDEITVSAESAGYIEFRKTIRLSKPGEEIDITMEKSPAPDTKNVPRQEYGYVTINAKPWAYVFYGSKNIGTTPVKDFKVQTGVQRFTLKKGSSKETLTVKVRKNEHSTHVVEMK